MSKTKLFFIRHGQSLGNARFLFLGHTDLDLTELGYRQASASAEYLSDEKIDVIYSSDLLRAFNTAVPNANLRNLEVIPRQGLREVFCGEWEGMNVAEIEEKYGELYTYEWPCRFGSFKFPSGESTLEAGKRFYDEVLLLAKENEGKILLIVSHAAVLRSFWALISGILPEEISEKIPFATNASVSVAEFDGEKFAPISYSYDGHLAEIGVTKLNM